MRCVVIVNQDNAASLAAHYPVKPFDGARPRFVVDGSRVGVFGDFGHNQKWPGNDAMYSDDRLAILLTPGEYPDLEIDIAVNTSLHGLGKRAEDVSLKTAQCTKHVGDVSLS